MSTPLCFSTFRYAVAPSVSALNDTPVFCDSVSPHRWLAWARELMTYSFLTLEDCALQSGFSSLQYFCRVFKKGYGITPAKYRESRK